MKALKVPVSLADPIEVVDIDGTFKTMYPIVGTDMLEHVSIQLLAMEGMALYVDEESLLKPDPQVNVRLSVMYPGIKHGQFLYGVGIIVAEEGPECDIVDLPEAAKWAAKLDVALSGNAAALADMLV